MEVCKKWSFNSNICFLWWVCRKTYVYIFYFYFLIFFFWCCLAPLLVSLLTGTYARWDLVALLGMNVLGRWLMFQGQEKKKSLQTTTWEICCLTTAKAWSKECLFLGFLCLLTIFLQYLLRGYSMFSFSLCPQLSYSYRKLLMHIQKSY